jgi:hypothetical protein
LSRITSWALGGNTEEFFFFACSQTYANPCSRLIPPFSGGLFITFRLTEALLPHPKLFIIFCSFVSTSWGIPWTVARYWVIPPANMLTINCLAIRVGCCSSYRLKMAWILSRFFDQIASSSIPFPIHPPRMRMGSFSLAMWMLSAKQGFSAVVFLVSMSS